MFRNPFRLRDNRFEDYFEEYTARLGCFRHQRREQRITAGCLRKRDSRRSGQSSLEGIPAAAFSLAFRENTPVNTSWLRRAMPIAAKRSAEIVERLLEMNLPRGVDYLNVNFPPDVGPDTPVKITRAARTRYEEDVEERRDPRFKSTTGFTAGFTSLSRGQMPTRSWPRETSL
jgi:5'/3'-nucleotidase SurE